jgi:hypothetical protein
MQKRKISKDSKVTKLNPDDLSLDFFEDMMEELAMDHGGAEHVVGQMMPPIMNSAIELSKLVVENRVRNSEHMVDNDIYDIYKKSFMVMMEELGSAPKD